MTRNMNLALSVIAAGTLLSPARSVAGQLTGIDLSGHWIINTELSDDPREVMKKKKGEMHESQGDTGGRGGGKGGGMGGGRGGGRSGGRPPRGGGNGDANEEQMQERFQRLEAHNEIMILQEGDDVTMIYASGDTLTLVPDGATRTYRTTTGEVTVGVVWNSLVLRVQAKRSEGPEITRLYRINNDGRLEVATLVQLPGENETVEIVSVYDELAHSR